MTTTQKINLMHETRMWIVMIIGAAIVIDRINPQLKYDIRDKVKNVRSQK